jgi:hypothetical protein
MNILNKIVCFYKEHDIEYEYNLSRYTHPPYIEMRGKCKRCGDFYTYFGFRFCFSPWLKIDDYTKRMR